MILRSKVIAYMRKKMVEQGFTEYQTPILTASSPEGARDFLVPSRINPGKFYALPQAPQQFKQLLMVSGFDRYFQIAPCFRDEDPRADRSPGEFYQLDMEMSFVEQEDVFQAIEYVMGGVFNEFSNGRKVDQAPFRHIPFREAMLKYGSDKPDLRNPLEIADATPFLTIPVSGCLTARRPTVRKSVRLSLRVLPTGRVLSLTSLTLLPRKKAWAAWLILRWHPAAPRGLHVF